MNPEDYVRKAMRTCSGESDRKTKLQEDQYKSASWYINDLVSEMVHLGDAADEYKKYMYYDAEIPKLFKEETLTGSSSFFSNLSLKKFKLLHALLGLITETAEIAERFSPAISRTDAITNDDITNYKEELGDLMWYIARACDALGFSLSDVMETNIKKLETRYPDKFTTEKAMNRDIEKELKVLCADNCSDSDYYLVRYTNTPCCMDIYCIENADCGYDISAHKNLATRYTDMSDAIRVLSKFVDSLAPCDADTDFVVVDDTGKVVYRYASCDI